MILAIVVTYNPDLSVLRSLLKSLFAQVDNLVIVDNNSFNKSDIYRLSRDFSSCICEFSDDNAGIGFAINKGVQIAYSLGVDFVLLVDQDSIFTPNSILLLVSRFSKKTFHNNKCIAAVGPRFVDAQKGVFSEHVKFGLTKIGRIPCRENQHYVSTDFLITSGSLIPLHVLDDVGPMDETLFIDHVDTEWCLRAKSKGYELLGDCEALMEHDLGEYRKRIWFFRWREVPVHKAFRYYYIFRNSVLLYRRKYIPWSWIRIDLIRLIQIFGFTLLFGPDRLGKIAMMFRGVRDAFLGKTGKLDSKG